MKTSALYIHIPFCETKCKYCDFTSYCDYDMQNLYFDTLQNEIALSSDMWRNHVFDTIFFGGGTPSSVDAKYIQNIMHVLSQHFKLDIKEANIEANPGTVDLEKLSRYIDMGFNRISFGMQATQDDLLKTIGRTHTFSQAQQSIALAKQTGFQNISVDLMSGLPTQNADDLTLSVLETSKMDVNHISMYTLKLEEGTQMHRDVRANKTILPSLDAEYDMSKSARHTLCDLGYMRYEISNYAKDGAQCLHNLHYWHNDDYLGVGVSAASSKNGYRTTNVSAIKEYAKRISDGSMPYQDKAQSSDDEFAFETLMLGLRLVEGVNIVQYYIQHGIQLDKRFCALIISLEKRELITLDNDILNLTEKGMDVQNSVLVEFMDGFDF